MGEFPRVLWRCGVEVNKKGLFYPVEDDERYGSYREKEGHARRVGQAHGEDNAYLGVPVRDLVHPEEESSIGCDRGQGRGAERFAGASGVLELTTSCTMPNVLRMHPRGFARDG